MAKLELKSIKKSFGENEIIKDINLEIKDGEFVVFVGPSGCGKSTLLRIIAGIEEANLGQILIDDIDVTKLEPIKREIAMVFQSYALYPHLNVYENMAFALKIAKLPIKEIENKVKAAAEILNISHLLKRKPKELSGGQRQRVAIGRAIVRSPKIFLFDEPLSNLDAALRNKMRYEFANISKNLATTIIYVTHDQVEAMTLADKIVVLNNGEICQYGAPMDLYNAPKSKFVAEFIGTPKMNFIEAKVSKLKTNKIIFDIGGNCELEIENSNNSLAINDEITIGIRPEHLSIDENGPIKGKVSFIEKLGGIVFAYVETIFKNETIIVQLPYTSDLKVNSQISLKPSGKIHFFDKNGMAI